MPTQADLDRRDQALHRAFPELTPGECRDLGDALTESANIAVRQEAQHTDPMTAAVLERFRPGLGGRARQARDAMASGWLQVTPFPGAWEMLRTARDIGLRTILVSNASWPSAELYRRRLENLGLADQLDAIVCSVDIGVRKPDPRMFRAAIDQAGCPPDACVMVGDSEARDIEPAIALGMRAIRVTMQYPLDGSTRATEVATSLPDVAAVLRNWTRTKVR